MLDIDGELPDKWKEECGVFAIVAPKQDVARLTYFGLFALQHRGQESAGIAITNNKHMVCYKDMGLVTQAFSEKILNMLKGDMAIGHVRYSTTGSSVVRNAQPIEIIGKRHVALAHNGNLVNAASLREKYGDEGIQFHSSTDSEVIAEIIANGKSDNIVDAVKECMDEMQGAYSIVMLANEKIYAFRDPHGVRPLCLGKMNGTGWVLSSETCGLDIVGAELVRDIEPGELIELTADGPKTLYKKESPRCATCVFEFIYFARPDSYILNQCLYNARVRMGKILAIESPADADVVISVPDSGTPAAIGFAAQSGIPFHEGLVKNRYVGRTFINPDQRIRALGIKMKLNPLRETIEGKRVVLVDDSIVRGTTSSKIIALVKEFGAKEVHMRVSSPPVKHSCFYGIDTAEAEDLIASSLSVENIRGKLGPDSLKYLSVEGLVKATGLPEEKLCMACFTGDYPIPLPPRQLKLEKMVFEAKNQ